MKVIKNNWVEKQKKKKTLETSPAQESDSLQRKPFINVIQQSMKKTLRGVRK